MSAKKWTILVYLAGDNNLDEDGARDLAEMAKVGSNDDINIVAQFDRVGTVGTQRLYITKGGGYPEDSIANLSETNCGDPKVVVDFLNWGVSTYPAEKYMAILWNHGSGWDEDDVYDRAVKVSPDKGKFTPLSIRRAIRGKKIKPPFFSTTKDELLSQAEPVRAILYDDESKDFLDNKEMKNVLTEGAKLTPNKRFDIVGFDACLMNTIEVAYQLKDTAKMIVCSQETEPSAGWAYDKFLGALATKPSMSPQELGKVIVDTYIKSYDIGANSEAVTMAAVNPEKVTSVLSSINKWALALKKNIMSEDTFNTVLICTEKAQKFYYPTYKDIFDMARLLKEKSKVKEIQDTSAGIMDALKPGENNYMVASKTLTPQMANAHGASIYFPGREMYKKYYSKLDFAKKSKWDEFLRAYQKAYDTL